jgi:hypothetical protein
VRYPVFGQTAASTNEFNPKFAQGHDDRRRTHPRRLELGLAGQHRHLVRARRLDGLRVESAANNGFMKTSDVSRPDLALEGYLRVGYAFSL